MTNPILPIAAAAAALVGVAAEAQTLQPVFSSDLVINGPTTTKDGRLFLAVQPPKPGATPQVIEVRGGKPVAYPDARWNGWTATTASSASTRSA